MMQTVTMAASLAVWWSAACRIGQMDRRHHRLAPMLWHWALSAVALLAAGWALLHPGDRMALGTVAAALLYVMVTLPDWDDGPPDWVWRPGLQPMGARHPVEGVQ